MRLVIKGSEWDRGYTWGHAPNHLLNTETGKRCCLGIHAKACGIPDKHLAGHGPPSSLARNVLTDEYREAWLEVHAGVRGCNDDAFNAMEINDRGDLSDEERIEQLRPIFRKHGITLVWRPDL